MFNFQKEVVLNSIDKVAVIEPGNGGAKGTPNIDKKLRFLDGGEYFFKYIVDKKIYRTEPIKPVNFTLTITPKEGMLNEHVQILIELGLDNDYRGDYGSALWYFRKPILVDVTLPSTEAGAAEVITKAIKRAIPQEYKFVTVSDWAPGKGDVTITGADSYQKVRKVVINKFICEDRCAGSSEELDEFINLSGDELKKGNSFIAYTRNNVEFGTYEYLLHNLRLPTYENLRFTSTSAPEMPIKGKEYVQYSFAYCVPRVGFGGLSVVGQTNQSTTLHTFFVNKDIQTEFEEKLAELDDSLVGENGIVDVDRTGNHVVTILPDGYASTADLISNNNADQKLAEKVTEIESKNTEQDSSIAANTAALENKADTSALETKADKADFEALKQKVEENHPSA